MYDTGVRNITNVLKNLIKMIKLSLYSYSPVKWAPLKSGKSETIIVIDNVQETYEPRKLTNSQMFDTFGAVLLVAAALVLVVTVFARKRGFGEKLLCVATLIFTIVVAILAFRNCRLI
jgi:hypothetical protein